MTLSEAHARLRRIGEPVFRTGDAAAFLGLRPDHASQILGRLERDRHLFRLKHALWSIPDKVDRLALPGYLTAPFPSYVSLQSALYFHGLIEQIPVVTYAVSLARTRRYDTPLGTVSIHHVDPAMFFGFEDTEAPQARMAGPEKALIDLLYLGPAKSRLFHSLPELEFPKKFNVRRARGLIGRIASLRRRSLVRERFERLIAAGRLQIASCGR